MAIMQHDCFNCNETFFDNSNTKECIYCKSLKITNICTDIDLEIPEEIEFEEED